MTAKRQLSVERRIGWSTVSNAELRLSNTSAVTRPLHVSSGGGRRLTRSCIMSEYNLGENVLRAVSLRTAIDGYDVTDGVRRSNTVSFTEHVSASTDSINRCRGHGRMALVR